MHVFANVLAQITMIRKSNDSAMRSRIFKKLLLFICAFKYKKGGGRGLVEVSARLAEEIWKGREKEE